MGPMKHHNQGSYLDDEHFIDGQDHLSITTATIVELVRGIGARLP